MVLGTCLYTNGLSGGMASAESPSIATQGTVGSPAARWCVAQAAQEVESDLKARNIAQNFATFRNYAGSQLDFTAGLARTSEVTGNCRLRWYDHMMRDPLPAARDAEQFTRDLHQALRSDHRGLERALLIAAKRMDVDCGKPRTFPAVASPEQAEKRLQTVLADVRADYAAAIAPLSPAEVAELSRRLYPILTGQCVLGHALGYPSLGRRMCDILEKMDRQALFSAAAALAALSDPQFLSQLGKMSDASETEFPGVSGKVVQAIDTPAGKLIIGGRGSNTYDLDGMPDVCAVVDLGGNDVYLEGTVSVQRPLLTIIDLSGDDRYAGKNPGIQGGAICGVSLLIDAAGDDTYEAQDVAQGSAMGGVGMLIDFAGNDRYRALRRAQGQALGGVGILLDRSGEDDYHAAMWAQGFGAPLGFGLLDDLAGDDHFYCGGMWRDSYPETPGYEGWGQGVGAGIRQVGDGGIGVILDGGGDDVYEYDYFAHGGGYWLGAGFARDFGGNDRRLGPTRTAYQGGPRGETAFDRFSCGFGCHYAIGFCLDDEGDDTYGGTIMGLGFAWDCSVGMLFDFDGNDRYEATGGHTQGNGAQAGLGILFDYGGDDTYLGYSQGRASSGISYHRLPRCGGNFSFLIDYGGDDTYGCGTPNNGYHQRGSAGGFIVDRPLPDETDDSTTAGLTKTNSR